MNVDCRTKLHAHALPDSAILQIPVLLSMRNFVVHHLRAERLVKLFVHRRIDDSHSQVVHSRFDRVRNIECEGRVTALVRAHGNAVDKHFCKVIDSAELENYLACVTVLWRLETSAVPGNAHVVTQIFVENGPRYANAGAPPPCRVLEIVDLQIACWVSKQAPAVDQVKTRSIIAVKMR